MFRESRRMRRRLKTPPRETWLTRVLGEFLDPIDALFAIFYSILFAMLFTLSYGVLIYRGVIPSAFTSGYGQDLVLAIVGVVAVWGVIDGVLYLLGGIFTRSERRRLLQSVQSSESESEAVAAIADELDFVLEPITSDEQRQALYRDVLAYLSRAEPKAVGLERADVVGAVTLVAVSVIAVLPSMLPLLLMPDNFAQAIRLSNIVSVVVIFAAGYSWGVHTGTNPWKTGLLLASICLCLVLLGVWLGG